MTDDLAGQIRRNLWAITDHYDAALEPVRRATGSQVKASKEPPLPIGAHILDVRTDAHRDLAYWAWFILENIRDINNQQMSSPFNTSSITEQPALEDLIRFVVIWVGQIVTEFPDDADNLAAEAEKHAKALAGITDPFRKDWVNLGSCPLDIDSEAGPVTCGGDIRAKSVEGEQAQATCRGCGVTAVVPWWERLLMPDASRLITAAELPEFVRNQFGKTIKEPTVRKWIERGVIESSGTDDKGRTLYDKGAVAYALARREIGA